MVTHTFHSYDVVPPYVFAYNSTSRSDYGALYPHASDIINPSTSSLLIVLVGQTIVTPTPTPMTSYPLTSLLKIV